MSYYYVHQMFCSLHFIMVNMIKVLKVVQYLNLNLSRF